MPLASHALYEMSMKILLLSFLALALGTLLGIGTYISPSYGEIQTTPSTRVSAEPVVIKVLVALKGKYKLEGDLDAVAIKVQRNAIATAQDRVINAIKAETETKPNLESTARVKRRFVTVPGLALELKPKLVAVLKQLPDVSAVYEDGLNQPYLASTTEIIGTRLANHNRFGVDGTGQVVAVLDSGIDRNHPFLGTKRFVSSACFSTSSWFSDEEQTLCPNGEEQQFGGSSGENCVGIAKCDHGTHVAGIVGGFRDDNGNGLVDLSDTKGVAPRVKFVAMQIFTRINNAARCGDAPAPCIRTFDSDIIAGLDRVELLRDDHPIAAVNLSLGDGKHESTCDENFLMKWAIDDLRSRQISTVVSSGNDGFSDALGYPACISSAISVGNTQDNDTANTSSNTASFLKLLAPGTNVISSVPGTGFASKDGTSMAAPHVAGLWALMKQHRLAQGLPTSVGSILDRLQDTGVDVTEDGVTTPRVDAMKALALKSVEILTTFNTIDLNNAQPVTRTVTLKRHNFNGELNLLPTIESGNPDDLTISFDNDPTTASSVSMTITPALFANGSYTLDLRGAANQVRVFAKRLTINVNPPAPIVTGLSPSSGPATTWVTITGQNFSRLTKVQFVGSTRINPVVDSNTELRVRVPTGAESGPIQVFNANRVVTTTSFTITSEPTITNVSPDQAPVGNRVLVNGANFSASSVRINNVPVANLSITPTQLRFDVPQTNPGTHVLRVSNSEGSDTTNFKVGYPTPTVLGFSPQAGLPGDTVILSGSGFYAPVSVQFCNRFASVTVTNPSQLQAVVPKGTSNSCSVRVNTPGGTASANQNFIISQ